MPPCWPWPAKHQGKKHVMRGISYAPVPIRSPGTLLPDDDFMSLDTEALWGKSGRNDLSIIKAIGANAVRLYGNDPALDHSQFLDEALKQGLDVIAGVSDYPYTQMQGNCLHTDFDCYSQIKEQYSQNLQRGFLLRDGSYHTALQTVILMNEPDLKFVGSPRGFKKALVSAFDAVLDAEREAGVEGASPNFTVTFSFGVCQQCEKFGYKPGLGQMLELRAAMQDPQSVGYEPRNDLWTNYRTRFVNSVNTANPSTDIPRLFLDTYDVLFQGTPVFIGEYHDPEVYEKEDLQGILKLAADESTLLMGIAFFEFQVRYDKGGSEMAFGMFGLSEESKVTDFDLKYKSFTSWCLTPIKAERRRRPPGMPGLFLEAEQDTTYVHAAVTEAFGGEGVDESQLCPKITTEQSQVAPSDLDHTVDGSQNTKTATSVPVTWVGCFTPAKQQQHMQQPKIIFASGHNSNTCAIACQSLGYMALSSNGECQCLDQRPTAPLFEQVAHEKCGDVCEGEEDMVPTRYCGGASGFAAYSVYRGQNTPVAQSAHHAHVHDDGDDVQEAASLKYLLARHPDLELGTGTVGTALPGKTAQSAAGAANAGYQVQWATS